MSWDSSQQRSKGLRSWRGNIRVMKSERLRRAQSWRAAKRWRREHRRK